MGEFADGLGSASTFEIGLDFVDGKFEAMVGGVEGAVAAFRNLIEAGGGGEFLCFLLVAFLLGCAEVGEIFVALAAQSGFLELQIAELLFVDEVRFEFDHAGLSVGWFGGEFLGELAAAAGIEGEFESGDAAETPIGIGDRLNQLGFADADGLEFADEAINILFVGGGIVGGQQDGAAGEGGFESVGGGLGFAFRGAGAGGEGGVGAIGGQTGGGDFDGFFRYGAFGFKFGRGCSDDSEFTAGACLAGELFGFAFLGAADRAGSHDEAE